MTPRQEEILSSLIREYIATADPIGSEVLVERYQLPYSPATVRAEFGALEEEGFLGHPYTSAGRVPTAHGYRYFVDHVVTHPAVPLKDRTRVARAFHERALERQRIARHTAKLLATLTGHVAVTGLFTTEELHEAGLSGLLEEPEFYEKERVQDVSHTLDALEEHFPELTREPAHHVRVYIGEENPYVRTPHLAIIIAPYTLRSGDRGILALIGPTRMRYERNISLLSHLAEVLEHFPRS